MERCFRTVKDGFFNTLDWNNIKSIEQAQEMYTEFLNSETNSLYFSYNNSSVYIPEMHAISIVGWDDNYNVTKFPETSRPTLNGAWIARNSWGEIIEYDLNKFKEELYNMMPDRCKELGWNTPRRYSKHFYRTSWLCNF